MCAEFTNPTDLPQPYSEWRSEPNIPYKIWCGFNSETGEFADGSLLDEQHPAQWRRTPDLSLDPNVHTYSISIFMHHSIPPEFLDVVYFHEITEAADVYGEQKLDENQAHKFSVEKTKEYAQKNLNPEAYSRFEQWQQTLSGY